MLEAKSKPKLLDQDYKDSVYAPLLDRLNLRKRAGLFVPLIRAIRCSIMIVVAMVLQDSKFALLQVVIFMLLSLLTLFYLAN